MLNKLRRNRLLVLDVVNKRILSVSLDGKSVDIFLDGLHGLPDGIAIDYAGGHVYWSEMGNLTGETPGGAARCSGPTAARCPAAIA
jgi:sugar lactone lactonase YvrE